ncbi:MAG TPA: efflux RND transporter periplasmic adaptor subunit [Stenotrophomonas sp.]|nr:efflux RND transporter periplasmic adaptor subunit [Stenotrophomonas sp.]
MSTTGGAGRLCGCLAALVLGGCGGAGDGPAGMPATVVSVEEVRASAVPNLVELPGRVEAVRSAQVRARSDGIVEQQLYVEGTDVAAGAPLFQIDRRDLQARLQQARAALASARAARGQTAGLRARLSTLVQRKAVSVQEYESAQASFQQADAALMEAQAAVDRAQLQLDFATVRAPIAGRVGRALVSEGALVSAAAATLMTQVDQLDPVYVTFQPSNASFGALEQGMADGRIALGDGKHVRVTLLLDEGAQHPVTGVVDFTEKAVDPATGSRTLRARFDNPQRRLLPGQFVRGVLAVGVVRDGVSLPERAIAIGEDEASVMTVNTEGIAVRQPVTLAGQAEGRWVVQSGLEPGERVIVDGWHKIQPGQHVQVQPAKAAKPGS